jgi:hypothetical protein
MAFRKSRSAKPAPDGKQWSEGELIWGVPRRPGYDDQDDPKGHAGLTQHAFEPGNDERAICGYEPPKRAAGPTAKPRPQLAMPTARLNPRCAKCARLIETPEVPTLLPALAAIEAAAIDAATTTDAAAMAEAAAAAPEPPRLARPHSATKASKPERPPSESWEGTAVFRAGDVLAMVRPPSQPGLGVVASVVSGPSGTRVVSVNIDADGIAVITLSEPARAPVTVAWFAVPAVDHVPAPPAPPPASPEGPTDHGI